MAKEKKNWFDILMIYFIACGIGFNVLLITLLWGWIL